MTEKNKDIGKKSKKGIVLRLGKYVLQQWPLFILALLLTLGANQLSLLGYFGVGVGRTPRQSFRSDFGRNS